MLNKTPIQLKLTKNDFNKACRSFYSQSTGLNDNWQLVQTDLPGNQLYLKKINSFISYEIDSKVQYCRIDFHIVFSPSYSVPSLYFLAFKLDGSVLNIKEIYNLINWNSHQSDSMGNIEFGGAISQGDHPILNSPFFFIHPCRTTEVLETLFINNDYSNVATTPCQLDVNNYLKIWLGFIANPIGLVLNIKYYT